LSSADIADKGGSSDADIRHLLMQNPQFFKIDSVSAWTREVKPVRTFFGQERGVNFPRFCADVWTRPRFAVIHQLMLFWSYLKTSPISELYWL